MFIAALFTIAKTWKQPKCPLPESEVAQLGLTLCNPMDDLGPWYFPGKDTGEGCRALLQGLFLTQGLNLCLLCHLH